jgi:hypothetical protein
VQALLGHKRFEPTMNYIPHTPTKSGLGLRSPLDGERLRWKDAVANLKTST